MEAEGKGQKKRGLRTGYTTGACAAAAAKAAARCLVSGTKISDIETTLPNGQRVTFALKQFEIEGPRATCSVIKDAGDDPDCTHGAELVAEVELAREPGITIQGGPGVATVTLSLRIFQEGLLFFNYGVASAVSMVLMAIVALVGLLGLIWFRRREVVM